MNPARSNQLSKKSRLNADEIEQFYPYPAIPHSTRPYLERSLQIDDINNINPDSSRETNRLRRMRSINRSLGLVRTYCGNELNGSAYKAAALGTLEDTAAGLGVRHVASSRATEELGKFFVENSHGNLYGSKNIYIAGLLQDRRRLDKFRQAAKSGDDELDYESDSDPSKSEWLSDPTITDADTLYDAVSTINIESILISGAETLADLRERQRRSSHDRATLDLVRYSEQIIAPVAEVIGFDALAMSLNGTTKEIRLTNGGRDYLLDRADALIDRYRALDRGHSLAHNATTAVNGIVKEIFENPQLDIGTELPVDYNDDNQAVYGDAPERALIIDGRPVNVSWRYRLKTRGSLGWKLYKAEERGYAGNTAPMDILGITAVVESVDDQVRVFKSLADGIYQAPNITPYASPSKSSPVHVRGTKEYIALMTQNLTDRDVDTRTAESADALHYGKVTGFYGEMPFEIQCVTRKTRDAMQTGPTAHIIYKANAVGTLTHDETERWTELLASIRGRRGRIGDPKLVSDYPSTIVPPEDSVKLAQEFISDQVDTIGATQHTIGYRAVNGERN